MVQLREDHPAVLVHGRGQPSIGSQRLRSIRPRHPRKPRRRGRMHDPVPGDQQPRPTLRPRGLIRHVPIRVDAVACPQLHVRRLHDPVANRDRPDRQRAEQMRIRRHHPYRPFTRPEESTPRRASPQTSHPGCRQPGRRLIWNGDPSRALRRGEVRGKPRRTIGASTEALLCSASRAPKRSVTLRRGLVAAVEPPPPRAHVARRCADAGTPRTARGLVATLISRLTTICSKPVRRGLELQRSGC